jgi:hypothetical protein
MKNKYFRMAPKKPFEIPQPEKIPDLEPIIDPKPPKIYPEENPIQEPKEIPIEEEPNELPIPSEFNY